MNFELIFEKRDGEEYKYCDFVRQLNPSISEQKSVIRSFIEKNEYSLTNEVNEAVRSHKKEWVKNIVGGVLPTFICVVGCIRDDKFKLIRIGVYME